MVDRSYLDRFVEGTVSKLNLGIVVANLTVICHGWSSRPL